jgi:hypothetical protein
VTAVSVVVICKYELSGYKKRVKGKAIPVTGSGGPQGCERLKLPDFLVNWLTDDGEVVSLM